MRLNQGLTILAVAVTVTGFGLNDRVFAQGATPVATTTAGASTLVVVERATTDVVIDQGEEGDSVGDLLAFGNAIYDEANENEVGTSQGSCVRTVPGEAWECMFSVILDEGQISVAGPFYDAGSSVLAITGGTGAYASARGEMRLEATGEAEFRFTFQLG